MDILKIQINVILETTASKRKRRRISSCVCLEVRTQLLRKIKLAS